MKKMILMIMLLTGFNSFSQTKIDSSKSNDTEVVEQEKSKLELIAKELDISEKQAYESVVMEQRVQAFRNIMILITMILSLITLRKSFKIKLVQEVDKEDKDLYSSYLSVCGEVVRKVDKSSSYRIEDILKKVAHPPNKINNNATQFSKAKKITFISLSLSVFIVSFIYNSIMLSDTFTGLFNPEYGALEQLEFLMK